MFVKILEEYGVRRIGECVQVRQWASAEVRALISALISLSNFNGSQFWISLPPPERANHVAWPWVDWL